MSGTSNTKKWSAAAPSNIALIKYMGKTDSSVNRPTNSSLSYTLSHLQSYVELELSEGSKDTWELLKSVNGKDLAAFELNEKGRERFLKHLGRLKEVYGFSGAFKVRSANDFPSDCGLASSASSFAALTMVALKALPELTGKDGMSVDQAAEESRRGSGSSCRSFYAPWSVWSPGGVWGATDLPFQNLIHQVVVVNDSVKKVSSSEAHQRVLTSQLFKGRPERAEERAEALMSALRSGDWREAFEISWAEFWDMHALFETSQPSFGYMTAESLEVLRFARGESWDLSDDGPLVTMDAGPNVHLLHRKDEFGLEFARRVKKHFGSRFRVVTSIPHDHENAVKGNLDDSKPGAKG